jgi:predicted HicB family RNase H-like nuclease
MGTDNMIMQLEGYVARIDYDEDEKTFRGKVANIRDSIVFVGKTPEELEEDFAEQLKFYFEVCKKRGKEPDRPYSGQFVLRVDPEIHRALAVAADRENKSLNRWAAETLARAAAG